MHFAFLRYAESTKDRACPHDLRIRKHGTEERRCPCTSLESYNRFFKIWVIAPVCTTSADICKFASFCICWGSLHKLLTDKHTLVTRSHFSLFCLFPTRVASKKPWGSTILQLALNCRSQELFGLNLCHLPRQVSPWSFRQFQLNQYLKNGRGLTRVRTYVFVKQKDLQQSTEVCRFGGIKYVVSTQPVHCHEGLGQAKAAHEWRQANTYRQLPRLPSFFS